MNNKLIHHLFKICKQINEILEKWWLDSIYGNGNWKIVGQLDLRTKAARIEREI